MPLRIWSQIGWAGGFIACVCLLTTQELILSVGSNCGSEANRLDWRWILRSADFFLVPMTFATSLDVIPKLGDEWLKLSYQANQRKPPLLFPGEWIFPSWFVGESIYFVIYTLCWIGCSPIGFPLVTGIIGICFLVAGVTLSLYLRGRFFFFCPCNCPAPPEESEIPNRPMEKEAEGSSEVGPGPVAQMQNEHHHDRYAPRDNVLTHMAKQKGRG